MNPRRDVLKSFLAAPLAAILPKTETKVLARARRLKPFVMEAQMNLVRGTGWDGIPRLAEVMLDESKDRDDLVVTKIEEIYYFTR